MDPRSNKIFLYVGDRGVGKTDLCKEVLAVSPQPKTYLLNSKQMNLEVHLVFHYLKQIPPNLLLMANYLTIFKTGENSFDKHRFFYPNFQQIFEYVKNSSNPHVNVTIRLK
jgi:hypothetical protein